MTRQTALTYLTRMFEANRPVTATDIDTNGVYMGRLEDQGLIRRKDVVRTGNKGRPAILWVLSDKGRKRVKRAKGLTA